MKRIRGTMTQFSSVVGRFGDEKQQRMQRILSIIIDETAEELADMDEKLLSSWIQSFGALMEWCATGDMSILPPELIPFACTIEGIDPASLFVVSDEQIAEEMKAIEA